VDVEDEAIPGLTEEMHQRNASVPNFRGSFFRHGDPPSAEQRRKTRAAKARLWMYVAAKVNPFSASFMCDLRRFEPYDLHFRPERHVATAGEPAPCRQPGSRFRNDLQPPGARSQPM
jgi:hypothetical protein